MNTIEYILFDAANTLIHKPSLWKSFLITLHDFGYQVKEEELMYKHKLLSEVIKFPDVTSQGFYNLFNKELLNALGIIDTPELLESIFNNCKYLPWEVFEDVNHISTFNCKIGVLSNFNKSLRDILHNKIPKANFKHIIISEEEGVAKPDSRFFELAIEKIRVAPNKILYIGDSLKLDIIPALQVGMNTKLIDRGNVYNASKYKLDSLKNIKII